MTRTLFHRAAVVGLSLTVTVVVLAGCGNETHGRMSAGDHSSAASTPSSSTAAASHNAADVMFAQMMIPHHRQAVAMADLAASRATNPQVKQLAAGIKEAQQPEIETMSGWLTAWGVPKPIDAASGGAMPGMNPGDTAAPGSGMPGMPGMNDGMPSMAHPMPGMMSAQDMAGLAAASGGDFDRKFLTMMIAHHEGAITMARDEIARGSNADARALAGRIIDAQRAEIDTMKSILARR